MWHRILILLTGSCLLAATHALAAIDYVAVTNAVRLAGCGTSAPAPDTLDFNQNLGTAARRVARGEGLIAAAKASGYLARNTASIHMRSVDDEQEAAWILAGRFCEIVTDSRLEDIGVYTEGNDVWMLIAKPLGAPGPEDQDTTVDRVLTLINEARSQSRRCGRDNLPAAPPLASNTLLEHAASRHAKDMAANNFLSHEGSDGSMPGDRVIRAGYDWRTVAENVAAGQPSADEVVETWLDSPGHCTGLMSAKYTETGIAFVVDEQSEDGIYWVQVFGSRD